MFIAEPKEIWIIGNFWITQAARKAQSQPDGANLGLDAEQFTVRWMGKSMLLWKQLMPKIRESVATLGAPSIVFINMGSSDLGTSYANFQLFRHHVKTDLSRLSMSYPDTAFIWSAIMPRKEWLNTDLEERRQVFNSEVSICATKCGFQVASLPLVEKMAAENYYVNASYSWYYIYGVFNTCIKEAVEKEIKKIQERI